MFSVNKLLSLAGLCASFPLSGVHAQNLVRNGDFEGGTGKTFASTVGWYNRGTQGEKSPVRNDSSPVDPAESPHFGQINDRYDITKSAFGPIAHNQKTAHVIQAGESFDLSYVWLGNGNAGWQRGRDIVRFMLFATSNDSLGGDVVWSSVLDSGYAAQITTWQKVSQRSEVVASAAVGRRLFVTFYGVDSQGLSETPGFGLLDNIVVQVSKPAP